jgi:hypothetical protein
MSDLTADTLNQIGIIRYLGVFGPDPATLAPTFIYQGQRRSFPPGLSLENMVRRMCAEFSLDYDAVTDPYLGLSVDQRIAKKVSERMAADGYTQELIAGIFWNQLKTPPRKPEEFAEMDAARTAITQAVYSEEGLVMPE